MNRLAFVRNVWADMLKHGGVEKVLFDQMKVVGAEPNKVVFDLPIDERHINRLGIVHGGVLSTLVDIGGSLALCSNGVFSTGVTTDLATTFLKAAGKPGQVVRMEGHCQRMGRTMAFTFVELKNPTTGELLARGNHTKYIANIWNSEKNVKFD
ncbi:Putative esterase C31F10.02 [Wickerhamiella sorbophila]|uniref:Esterase C31F10.02 n=1 Tax=Wickerhamiella sorbophila TaxID=45607 RepID=A0A2T0FD76_9ASCO|nr:Putative esterase C31F10.02 [Wickerhamiella sorbophila]PRT52963.1 Putative esterase C31F10.02 [Wickerhamiella sorbophila]